MILKSSSVLIIMIAGLLQGEDKFTAYTLCTDYIDVLVVGSDDFFHDGKPQSGAFLIFTSGQIRFVEAFPDQLQLFFGNTDTGVLDRDKDFVLFL